MNWRNNNSLLTPTLAFVAVASSALFCSALRGGFADEPTRSTAVQPAIVHIEKQRFDLNKDADLDEFIARVKALEALSKSEKSDKKEVEKENKQKNKTNRGDGPTASVEKMDKGEPAPASLASKPEQSESSEGGDDPDVHAISTKRDWSSSKVKHCLKAMGQIANKVREGKVDRAEGVHDILEIDWAMEQNFVTPYTWLPRFDPILDLFSLRSITLNASGEKCKRAIHQSDDIQFVGSQQN